jgi:ubiquinol-cytochrome c reductase cytochrome b subunit
VAVFLIVFAIIVFFTPEMHGYFLEYNNIQPANPLQTPPEIRPVWYFTPYYAMLRGITYPLFGVDAKFWGVVVIACAVLIYFFLPWLDRGRVKSIRYRGPIFKTALTLFVISVLWLGYLGMQAPSPAANHTADILMLVYFGFFILMPWYSRLDKCKPEPERTT